MKAKSWIYGQGSFWFILLRELMHERLGTFAWNQISKEEILPAPKQEEHSNWTFVTAGACQKNNSQKMPFNYDWICHSS